MAQVLETDVARFEVEDSRLATETSRRKFEKKLNISQHGKGSCSSEGSLSDARSSGKRHRSKKVGTEGGRRTKASSKRDTAWKQNSRSRRLVANARERSRIHILSDAFENLRRAVPSYSQDQKLSKLSILKLATYYISALANLAESDTSARSLKQFADCVAHCTKALQTEGRARRKQF